MSFGETLLLGLTKSVVAPFANAVCKADKIVENKTGKGLFDRYNESEERDEKLKKENLALWTAKHLAKGTVKGLTGTFLHKD